MKNLDLTMVQWVQRNSNARAYSREVERRRREKAIKRETIKFYIGSFVECLLMFAMFYVLYIVGAMFV